MSKITSFEQWKELENVFHASGQAKGIELRAQLQNLNKKGMSILHYINRAKEIVDMLVAI